MPERDDGVDASGDASVNRAHAGGRPGRTGADAGRDLPDPSEVVGFEDAPDPKLADERPRRPIDGPAAESSAASTGSTAAGADGAGTDAFEWVTDPVATQTVLADPETVASLTECDGGTGDSGTGDDAGVLDRLWSGLPF